MRQLKLKRKKNFLNLVVFAIILVTGASLYTFFFSKFFLVKSVDAKLVNVDCASENSLKEYSSLLDKNFFLVNASVVKEVLKQKYPCIQDVNLSKVFPNKIRLEVLGRVPKLKLTLVKKMIATSSSQIATPSADQVEESFILDDEGIVFSKDENFDNIPNIYTLKTDVSLGKSLAEPLSNVTKISQELENLGVKWHDAAAFDKFLAIQGKPLIIFSLEDKIEVQIASLQLILKIAKIDDRSLEFIDLRFDKPVVKFAPKKHG